MNRGLVITHPEFGVYIGSALGLGFWTELDCAGQTSCVTFPSETDARAHIESWDENNDASQYGFTSVPTVVDGYAEISELKAVGIDTTTLEVEEGLNRERGA